MPTATPFNALGAGNGFQKCVRKIDVSNFDHWTTISGVNDSSPEASDEKIQESLVLAVKYFWNLESISFSGEGIDWSDRSSAVAFNEEVTIKEYLMDYQEVSYEDLGASQPRSRVCTDIVWEDEDLGYFEKAIQGLTGYFDLNPLTASISPTVVRMYNGSTLDEDNFVGYGFAERYAGSTLGYIIPPLTNEASAGGDYYAGERNVRQSNYVGYEFCGAANDDSYAEPYFISFEKAEVDGMHFIGIPSAYYNDNESSYTTTYYVDGEEFTRTFDSTVTETHNLTATSARIESTRTVVVTDNGPSGDPYNVSVTGSAEVSIDGFNFYTY